MVYYYIFSSFPLKIWQYYKFHNNCMKNIFDLILLLMLMGSSDGVIVNCLLFFGIFITFSLIWNLGLFFVSIRFCDVVFGLLRCSIGFFDSRCTVIKRLVSNLPQLLWIVHLFRLAILLFLSIRYTLHYTNSIYQVGHKIHKLFSSYGHCKPYQIRT